MCSPCCSKSLGDALNEAPVENSTGVFCVLYFVHGDVSFALEDIMNSNNISAVNQVSVGPFRIR